jgi:hypothetical protein
MITLLEHLAEVKELELATGDVPEESGDLALENGRVRGAGVGLAGGIKLD